VKDADAFADDPVACANDCCGIDLIRLYIATDMSDPTFAAQSVRERKSAWNNDAKRLDPRRGWQLNQLPALVGEIRNVLPKGNRATCEVILKHPKCSLAELSGA
jgi:hypothetical protein